MSTAERAGTSLASVMRDQLLLVSGLAIFIGLESTETYYSAFGVRYQLMGLDSLHILYRGVTTLFAAPSLLIPYLMVFTWLALASHATSRRWRRVLAWQSQASFAFVFALVVVTYPLSYRAGRALAKRDVCAETSHLPLVDRLAVHGVVYGMQGDGDQHAAFRMLPGGQGDILLFRPLEKEDCEEDSSVWPTMIVRQKGDVDVLEMEPRP